MGADGLAEPHDLRQPPAHQSRPGIVPQAEGRGQPGGDGHDVFHRPPGLSSGNVMGCIDPEPGRVEQGLPEKSGPFVPGGDGHRRGKPPGDLFSETRPGEDRIEPDGKDLPHDLAYPFSRVDLYALGHVADLRPAGAVCSQPGEKFPERLGGEGQYPVV
ncbi:hypothetical protein SDC9_66113 [bioreactor metagenome]|uniref:Uncharacterized protein n=1 Tax=bioreactor metagenome TaxID=1076179 RepID=A0A644XUW7_9ZZZZ